MADIVAMLQVLSQETGCQLDLSALLDLTVCPKITIRTERPHDTEETPEYISIIPTEGGEDDYPMPPLPEGEKPYMSAELPPVPTKSEGKPSIPTLSLDKPGVPSKSVGVPEIPKGSIVKPEIPTISVGKPGVPTGGIDKPEIPTGTVGKPEIPTLIIGKPEFPSNSVDKPVIPTVSINKPDIPTPDYEQTGVPSKAIDEPELPTKIVSKPSMSLPGGDKPTFPTNSLGKPTLPTSVGKPSISIPAKDEIKPSLPVNEGEKPPMPSKNVEFPEIPTKGGPKPSLPVIGDNKPPMPTKSLEKPMIPTNGGFVPPTLTKSIGKPTFPTGGPKPPVPGLPTPGTPVYKNSTNFEVPEELCEKPTVALDLDILVLLGLLKKTELEAYLEILGLLVGDKDNFEIDDKDIEIDTLLGPKPTLPNGGNQTSTYPVLGSDDDEDCDDTIEGENGGLVDLDIGGEPEGLVNLDIADAEDLVDLDIAGSGILPPGAPYTKRQNAPVRPRPMSHFQPLCNKGFKKGGPNQTVHAPAEDINMCLAICHAEAALMTIRAGVEAGQLESIQVCAAVEFDQAAQGNQCNYLIRPETKPCHDDELEDVEDAFTFFRN